MMALIRQLLTTLLTLSITVPIYSNTYDAKTDESLAAIDPAFGPLVNIGDPAVPELKKELSAETRDTSTSES